MPRLDGLQTLIGVLQPRIAVTCYYADYILNLNENFYKTYSTKLFAISKPITVVTFTLTVQHSSVYCSLYTTCIHIISTIMAFLCKFIPVWF